MTNFPGNSCLYWIVLNMQTFIIFCLPFYLQLLNSVRFRKFSLEWVMDVVVLIFMQFLTCFFIMQQNTFQAVMATDGVMTFAFFIYIDLQWMGFSTFIGGFSTFIGFCSHAPSPQCSCTISNRLFPISFSTCNIRNNILSDLRSGSNVDTPGVYVHRVDGQEILRPQGECSTVTLSFSVISSIA